MTEDVGGRASWCWSFDEEHYRGEEASREAAVAAATLELDGREGFWTGRAVPAHLHALTPDGGWIIDSMRDAAADQVGGDYADAWLDSVSREQEAELEAAIRDVVIAWLTKHNELPNFYSVEDVQEHKATTPASRDGQT